MCVNIVLDKDYGELIISQLVINAENSSDPIWFMQSGHANTLSIYREFRSYNIPLKSIITVYYPLTETILIKRFNRNVIVLVSANCYTTKHKYVVQYTEL